MPPSSARRPAFRRRNRRNRAQVSLTPLIDVVFILLVFFMLVSSFTDWRTIALDAPAEAGDSGGDPRGAALLRLHAGGGLDLNGRAVEPTRLNVALRDLARGGRMPRVLVQPGPGVPLQRAVRMLDAVTAAGARDVKLLRGGS
jgi:biopolymer transport protein ExbD